MFYSDNKAWVTENIINNHGPFCAIYPSSAIAGDGVIEGDSPSFLYLVSANRGINNPEDPTQPSWGGQYVRDGSTNHYLDGIGGSTISKWKSQYQAEFAERADWMIDPSVTINTLDINLNNTVTIYPNPVKNELSINSENEFNALSIFNLEGSLIMEKKINTNIKSVSLPLNLAKGIYLVKLSNVQIVNYSKIIIE
jgi:hypothetical protein